jgi:hypothetical protein
MATAKKIANDLANPWKSGALAPRRGTPISLGFSPGDPQGLKTILNRRAWDAALKGPLFHENASVKEVWLQMQDLSFLISPPR